MENNNYVIRTMHREEVALAINWAAKEGWNPGVNDAECYYHADPNGFLIGLLDNEPIATISAVKYGESFGFLGFYIVHPSYRGKGYGLKIWEAGINYLKGCNIGLDGVVEQQENYKKYGFQLAYRNIRFEGLGGGSSTIQSNIVDLSTVPFATIEQYSRPFFPAKRTMFLKSWINQSDCNALGAVQNDSLAGYGVIRKALSGYKVGPLFANTPEIADDLFLALKQGIEPSQPVYLDIPEVNQEALKLAKRYNMQSVFETARMYSIKTPDLPLDRFYGVASFEVG
ncbi:GNAT family N-acetyltransferase [Spartinivicinus poritis]|uniref:GNAT family N-acetyltransferase n=1 Tax=Spartinivicinus poritis TaxID=2994640 RepID=A0ABT5UAD8_9GAMM|nr:GNAT family N-acetyltransferase [Spartinivicinus sp. A2-2]MDE1463339.1 GNAT family N-acetyltransferase [Spartinivicinus sp. A2-2]